MKKMPAVTGMLWCN